MALIRQMEDAGEGWDGDAQQHDDGDMKEREPTYYQKEREEKEPKIQIKPAYGLPD